MDLGKKIRVIEVVEQPDKTPAPVEPSPKHEPVPA